MVVEQARTGNHEPPARPHGMALSGVDGAAVRVDRAGIEWYTEILGPLMA